MNSYLKIGDSLPGGLNYLNLNLLSIPVAIQKRGSLLSAFNFTENDTEDKAGELATMIGTPVFQEKGVKLGKSNYIDTGVTDRTNFTMIVVLKPIIDIFQFNFAISNYTSAGFTGLGRGTGFTVSQNVMFYPHPETGVLTKIEFNNYIEKNRWVVLALSRNNGSFTYATRTKGASLAGTSACTTEVHNFTNIGIGSTTNEHGLGNQEDHSIFAYAAVHNKSFTESDLKQYIDSLALELNQTYSFNL